MERTHTALSDTRNRHSRRSCGDRARFNTQNASEANTQDRASGEKYEKYEFYGKWDICWDLHAMSRRLLLAILLC